MKEVPFMRFYGHAWCTGQNGSEPPPPRFETRAEHIIPAHKPEAGNFCLGPVTFQTYKSKNFECYKYSDSIARLVSLH